MRLGISAIGIDDGPSGTRSRLEGLIPALLATDHSLEVVLYLPRDARVPVAPEGPRVRHAPTPFRPGRRIQRWLRSASWPARLVADGVDVLLADYHPVVRAPPTFVTVHDLRALHGFGSAARRLWTARVLPRALARAAGVVVPTRTVGREVTERLGVAGERIHVVRNAPGADAGPHHEPEDLGEPYVLHVGPDAPRKNLDVLRLSPVTVALVGRPPQRTEPPFLPIGVVSRRRLLRLIAGARALVTPALAEGSGIPVLEALAGGTPVLAARAGALPETTGDGGLLLDPHDAEAWREAIGRADGLRSVDGARAVAGLGWDASAAALLEAIYRFVSS